MTDRLTAAELDAIRERCGSASSPRRWVEMAPWAEPDNEQRAANMSLIRHSRDDIPRLLDTIDSLERGLAEARHINDREIGGLSAFLLRESPDNNPAIEGSACESASNWILALKAARAEIIAEWVRETGIIGVLLMARTKIEDMRECGDLSHEILEIDKCLARIKAAKEGTT